MKKILLTSIATTAFCVSAFGTGQIVFENNFSSSSFITLDLPGNPPTGSGLVADLLWFNGSSYTLEDAFTSTFTGPGEDGQSPGQFLAGRLTIPDSGKQTFEVEAFYTYNGTEYSGTTEAFTARVNAPPAPAMGTDQGGWDGNLVLEAVPEPATIALAGLGAAVLLLFRRRTPSN